MSSTVERKLAAIMFTDIVGYTSQMSKDQDVAFTMLDTKRKALKPLIQKYKGTLVKEMGDGTLSHFQSAIDATNCSLDLQKSLKDNNDLNIRIGVHLGDTSFRDDDVFGDGVNIASRLEKMSPPGGVLVSKNVYDELSSRKGYDGISLGLQSMKGVGRLVEVFGLKDKYLNVPNPEEYKDTKVEIHQDKEVPSIAIIPFENKGKEEDVFYAYGISADLISDCSSAGLIRVASLSDIEKLDYTNLDNTELSQKLFVRYISQGILWKMGEMFQLSIELYDTKDKKIVWSDRWQEQWDKLSDIKGNLSNGLLKALDMKPTLEKKLDTVNPAAYEFYLKAKYKYEKRENTNDTDIARGLFQKAIELDDNIFAAKNQLGMTYAQMSDYEKAVNIFIPALKQAEKLNHHLWIGNNLKEMGIVYHMKGDFDKALNYYTRSHKICKKIGDKRGMGAILDNIGIIYQNNGDTDKALEYHTRSLEIKEDIGNKHGLGLSLGNLGNIYTLKGDFDKALEYHTRSFEIKEVMDDKYGLGKCLGNIGVIYYEKGEYDKALSYYSNSQKICEEIGDKLGMAINYMNFGDVYLEKDDYKKTIECLEKFLIIEKKIGLFVGYKLAATTTLYLSYKHIGKEYDVEALCLLIKETDNIEFELNLRLYKLLENKSYLETAYNQVQEKVSAINDGDKFLELKVPKAIVEEYNKVFKK